MHANNKAIYNCSYAPAEFKTPANTKLTFNSGTKRLYVHLFEYPSESLILPGYKGKIKYAQFLHDNSQLKFKDEDGNSGDLIVTLPKNKPAYEIPVIELVLE
jgi:alpha-L-fucosidase